MYAGKILIFKAPLYRLHVSTGANWTTRPPSSPPTAAWSLALSNPSSFYLMTEAYLSSSNSLLQCVSVCIETPGPLSCQVSITLLITRVGNWIFFLQRWSDFFLNKNLLKGSTVNVWSLSNLSTLIKSYRQQICSTKLHNDHSGLILGNLWGGGMKYGPRYYATDKMSHLS